MNGTWRSYMMICLALLVSSCQQIKIDKCLDNGGRWNYKLSKCEFDKSVNTEKENLKGTITQSDKSESEKETSIKEYQTNVSKIDTILLRYKEILAINDEQTQRNFVEVFPRNFKEMQETFGYDDEKGPAPHYDHIIGGGMIKLFSEIEPVDKKMYYNKLIDICIDAKWEADNIRDGFGIQKQLIKNPDDIYPILSNRSDDEIKSVFRFIFDGPHPDHKGNHETYDKLQNSVPSDFSRISKLLNEAFNKLIHEDH